MCTDRIVSRKLRSLVEEIAPALTPFMDKGGLLHVGGSMCKVPLLGETRHPVTLNAKHDATRLVILHYHLQSRCAGDAQVLNNLRQRYWVLKGIRAVPKVSFSCRTCRRRRSQLQPPIMADLPTPCLGYLLPPSVHWSGLLWPNLCKTWMENGEMLRSVIYMYDHLSCTHRNCPLP